MNSDSTKINYRPGDDDTLILILISCCRFGQPGATAVCRVGHLLYFPTHKVVGAVRHLGAAWQTRTRHGWVRTCVLKELTLAGLLYKRRQ